MDEIWKSIPEYEGIYEVSSFGRVKRVLATRGATAGRILCSATSHGYYSIRLSKNDVQKTYFIHQLVLSAFCGPSNLNCNHKNGNRKDNRIENLEYVAQQENRLHSLYVLKEKRSIDASIARQMRDAAAQGMSRRELQKQFGVTKYVVDDLLCGRTWKHA